MKTVNQLANRVKTLLSDLEFYSTVPIISNTQNSIKVNDIDIVKNGDLYEIKRYNKIIARFILKAWAVAFAVSLIKHNFNFSSFLLEENKRLGKFKEDIDNYQFHIRLSRASNDDTRKKILSDRLSRAEMQYRIIASDVLENIKRQAIV